MFFRNVGHTSHWNTPVASRNSAQRRVRVTSPSVVEVSDGVLSRNVDRTMRTSSRRLALLPAAALALALGAAPAAADDRPVPGPGTTVAAGAPALPKDISATSFLVADLDTGEILAAKDAHHRLLPASTLKVLTALTLIPRIDKKTKIVPTWDDVAIEG